MALPNTAPLVPAAQYLRMSTEHQRFSIANQEAEIAAYAASRGYVVVRTYQDHGISGLQIKRRLGLQALIADVVGGAAPFSKILVFDVSRWGRFQDPDQSAHYEFLCRDSGVDVEYCAEQFSSDGSLFATLAKSLKRVMAAEFSRELSAKVAAGKRRGALGGFWQGGPPGYGLRRMVIDGDGQPVGQLQIGEQKAIQSHSVVIVQGPPEELEIVRRIFAMYLDGLGRPAISDALNRDHITQSGGTPWTTAKVRLVLTNEALIGNLVYHKHDRRLGGTQRRRDPAHWLRVKGVVAPTISEDDFRSAARICQRRDSRGPRAEMLTGLKRLLGEIGYLGSREIDDDLRIPCVPSYFKEFGSLRAAYATIGYVPRQRGTLKTMGPFRERVTDLVAAQQAGSPDRPVNIYQIWKTLKAEGLKAGYAVVWNHIQIWHGPGLWRRGVLTVKGLNTYLVVKPVRRRGLRLPALAPTS